MTLEWLSKATKDERHEWMTVELARALAEQIKGLRVRDGLTQQQLADGLGTRQSIVAKWESGDYLGYTVNTLLRVAQFFDCALIVRLVGWKEFIAFTPAGPMKVPAKYADDEIK